MLASSANHAATGYVGIKLIDAARQRRGVDLQPLASRRQISAVLLTLAQAGFPFLSMLVSKHTRSCTLGASARSRPRVITPSRQTPPPPAALFQFTNPSAPSGLSC